jgi:hypothetical protein
MTLRGPWLRQVHLALHLGTRVAGRRDERGCGAHGR